ncbi:uncharacterized protein LOC130046638 [Ostrea edulis]|uniref:uncharacterized protein LOC130046638 n=1 Tax=Ostrea edulis TaxID=37623 RepID=UPI0024AFC7A0|nr:uncharacterized protein LOC130046638 [Ostrea edulis]
MTGVRSLKDKLSTPEGTKRVLSSLKLTPKSKIDECTQTKDQSEEFDVKIVVKYGGVERLKIIKEEHEQAVLKSLLNNASPRKVLKNLSLNENYKKETFEIVKNVILNEIKHISKKDNEIVKGHASNNEQLIIFDLKCTSQQLQLKAPYLYSVFSSVVGLQKKKNLPHMLTSLAVLLYGRSHTINQLQYILGLILQKCDLNREGMNIIHDLGRTISPTSLHKKTKNLVKQQENRLHSTMASYVEENESRHKMGNEMLQKNKWMQRKLHLHITSFPNYIEHMYMDQMRKKSVFLNCDLVDASENSSQEKIEIIQEFINLLFHMLGEILKKNVLEKVVFGEDVLTNERAFSAQEAMQNSPSEYESLLGVIHRPEGLHREMNFLLGIYQLFYKGKSSADKGSLYQLRNLINRRNVSGTEEVNSSYRYC